MTNIGNSGPNPTIGDAVRGISRIALGGLSLPNHTNPCESCSFRRNFLEQLGGRLIFRILRNKFAAYCKIKDQLSKTINAIEADPLPAAPPCTGFALNRSSPNIQIVADQRRNIDSHAPASASDKMAFN